MARKLMRTTTHVCVKSKSVGLLSEHRSEKAAQTQARAISKHSDQKCVTVMTAADFLAARNGEWTQEAAK